LLHCCCSKVHELLLAAAHQANPADRERMVGEAISPALGIANWLQLAVLVSHLAPVLRPADARGAVLVVWMVADGQYVAAAKILNKLADQHSTELRGAR
jgi:hypothetical protein